MNFGQPGFFNAANLPAGDSINGVSNFWVSSSVAAALGMATPNRPPNAPDGFIGVATTVTPGLERILVFLHEIGHALGRNTGPFPVGTFSELDLVRFDGPGSRLFVGVPAPTTAAYFSVDGGVKKVADWNIATATDFINPPASNLTPNDPFDESIGDLTKLTTADIQLMEALGFRVGPTALMALRRADGTYQTYGIGNNGILTNSQLGPIGPEWRFVTLGAFNDSLAGSASDMLLRRSTDGAFQIYNIDNNNQIAGSAFIAPVVGLNNQFLGVGNFSGIPGESGMLLRDTSVPTGDLSVVNISNNQITTSGALGKVGLNWQFSGIGSFEASPAKAM